MKKLSVISFVLITVFFIISCSDVRRTRGREYMPDMAYSRAYETYAPHELLTAAGVNYTALPVAGTIKRGELFPFSIPKDNDGDTINYVASRQVLNPVLTPDSGQLKESERMFLINCAICHGTKLDGNGPLYNDGKGPYSAAPKNLVGPDISAMPEGQIFYSITYGKGQMGPYGSQLSTSQRWKIVHYIRSRQQAAKTAAGSTASANVSDSTITGSKKGGADLSKVKK